LRYKILPAAPKRKRRHPVSTDQTIFRVASRQKPYAQLGNGMLRDKRLSFEARGALAFILSFPSNWQFALAWFCRDQGIGRDRARRIIREHVTTGYCVRTQERTPSGSWGSITYTFTDEPTPLTEKPSAADPPPVNPTPTKDCQSRKTERDEEENGKLHVIAAGTDGATGERLPFTTAVLAEIGALGLDAVAIVERYQRRTAGRRIADPSAYLLRMARDEAAKRLGVPANALVSLGSRNRAERACALAASVGAIAEPSPAVLRGIARRARGRGDDPDALIAAWRASVRGLSIRDANRSLLAFADQRAQNRASSREW
jgi:hypothetical protein